MREDEKKIRRELIERIEEIYEKTGIGRIIEDEKRDEFETKEGVRQGYPLSADVQTV